MNESSTVPWWDDVEQDPVHFEAARWLLRLQHPAVALEETLEWQRWMAADRRHADAFSRLEQTYAVTGNLQPSAFEAPGDSTGTQDDYDGSTSVGDWLALQKAPPRYARRTAPPISRRGYGALAAGLVCITVAVGWLGFSPRQVDLAQSPMGNRSIHTAIGENRTETLPDGSRVTLGGQSLVEASFDSRTRQLTLEQGEAFFVVAKDNTRPFTVISGDAKITALGTQFNIRRHSGAVTVAVVEGRVRVEEAAVLPAPAVVGGTDAYRGRAVVQVGPGQETLVDKEGIHGTPRVADTTAVMSWQARRLAFRGEPLREVLEDVNRYSAKPIVLEDETAADLKITGTVLGTDVHGWVESLAQAFGLQVEEERDRIVIRGKR